MIGRQVLVRTTGAGVHCGTLVSREGDIVTLGNAVRIWRWRGARTCSELALHGCQSAAESGFTRVAEMVPEMIVCGAHEIIPMTDEAWQRVSQAGWAQ